jgi:hypothetical protein
VEAEARTLGCSFGELKEASWKTREEKVKPKTAFESGNSPPKVSENGAPIQTGRGLEETKRRIMEAFEKVRQEPARPPQPQVELVYTEEHESRFHERAERFSRAALKSPNILKSSHKGVWEIEVPTKSADELIAEALRGTNERT